MAKLRAGLARSPAARSCGPAYQTDCLSRALQARALGLRQRFALAALSLHLVAFVRARRHTLHGGRFRMALMDRKPTSGRSLLRNVVDDVRLVDGPFPPRPCRISGIGVASDAHHAAIQCDRAPEGNSLRWPGSVVVAFLMRANANLDSHIGSPCRVSQCDACRARRHSRSDQTHSQ